MYESLILKRLIAIGGFILFLDQATKWWIHSILPYPSYHPYENADKVIEIIPDFFYLVYIGNTGAAWGIFSGYGFLLGIFSLFALLSIFYFRKHLELEYPFHQVCFGLVTGGIAGNLIDRFTHGYVVDFLDFWLPGYRWPAFNIADSAIVIGILSYVSYNLLFRP